MTDLDVMPMCDVPILAWSNQPIPKPMFQASFQPVVRNARTRKMPNNATHASIKSVLSLCFGFFRIFRVRLLRILVF